jgi:cytochrome c
MSSHGSDPLFWNKVAGSVLLAGLLAMVAGFIADLLMPHHELAENAYRVAVSVPSDQGAAPAAATAVGPEPVSPLLAAADVTAGEKLAKKCAACHTFDDGGANKLGPNLWNVVGRDKGAVDGFSYSSALSGLGGVWDYDQLNQFLFRPKELVPGTKMSFAGLKKAGERANLIAWLRTLSASPRPLPQ